MSDAAASSRTPERRVTFGQALAPVLFLLGLVVYGLILRPQVFDLPAFPLEVVFVLAASFAVAELVWLGHAWTDIQATVIAKLSQALPAFLIFFAIGMIIGSWMVAGTIPMLVVYGLKLIHPSVLYLSAFVVPVVFSMLTGTSWGSAGTVGVVVIGIADAMGGHLGITAGAVVGGAFFGDKLSPLSDTTNMAALAAGVDVYDHIRSMLYTTVPSAIIACTVYTVLGFTSPPTVLEGGTTSMQPFMDALDSAFVFSPFLLIPPLIVLGGSVLRMPTVPTLVVSVLSACALALLVQPFPIADVFQSVYRGFETSMAPWATGITDQVTTLLDRGGLYALIDAIVVAITVFVFIGAMDHVKAIDTVVNRVFRFAKRRTSTVLSTLGAAAVTNALTSNQYATSFIVADAFRARYDALGVSRKVLSRSLEDTGTMIESLVPWTPTAVFMVATLGVPFAAYAPWQILSIANVIIAPLLVILGIGMFTREAPPTLEGGTAPAVLEDDRSG